VALKEHSARGNAQHEAVGLSWRRRPAGDFSASYKVQNRRRDAGATNTQALRSWT